MLASCDSNSTGRDAAKAMGDVKVEYGFTSKTDHPEERSWLSCVECRTVPPRIRTPWRLEYSHRRCELTPWCTCARHLQRSETERRLNAISKPSKSFVQAMPIRAVRPTSAAVSSTVPLLHILLSTQLQYHGFFSRGATSPLSSQQ